MTRPVSIEVDLRAQEWEHTRRGYEYPSHQGEAMAVPTIARMQVHDYSANRDVTGVCRCGLPANNRFHARPTLAAIAPRMIRFLRRRGGVGTGPSR
jgi:hypothetical protein